LRRNHCAGLSRRIGFGGKALKLKRKRQKVSYLTMPLPGVFAQAFLKKACDQAFLKKACEKACFEIFIYFKNMKYSIDRTNINF
jgi:hypothetical protein